MTWIAEHARFVASFLRHPFSTGALVPSSRWLARHMIEGMRLPRAKTVVEVGPGTGSFTKAIAQEVPPDALFLAVELNPDFANGLSSKFPNVRVINDSAEHLAKHLANHGRWSADAILSSLPWASFPPDLQGRLMDAIAGALAPGGRFSTYAYVHAAWLPAARRFREMLDGHFRSVHTTGVVWWNLPPAVVYRCEK